MAGAVTGHGVDAFAGQAVAGRPGLEALPVEAHQAVPRAQPQAPFVGQHGKRRVGEAAGEGKLAEFLPVEAEQPALALAVAR